MSHLTRRRLVVCFFALIAFLRAKAPSFYLQSVFLPHASSRLPASQFSPIARGRPGVVGMRTMKTDAEPHSAHPRKLIGALQGKRYSSDDWFLSLRTWPRSFVMRRIRSHLIFQICLSALVCYLHVFRKLNLSFPAQPTALIGPVMGLLLVFRTNSSYARFWEARQVWGVVMNQCRSLAQMRNIYMTPRSPESASEFGQLLEAFPHILAVRLGVEPNPNNKLSTILEPDHPVAKILDEARSAGVRCSPNYLVYRMRQCVHNAFDKSEDLKIPHWQMLTGLDRLVDCIGGCERLLTTPVPYAYSRHTSRFLTLWCGSLPFILVSSFGWQAVPIVAFICWALFSLEEIGHLIENPFNMFSMHTFHVSLPIDRISADCGKEVRDVLDTYATLSSANDAPIV
eukprot:TRINITY_DN16356_c0_g4_i1.p1 TRINITY_DN16356_c0_g4~~TRINITY_DN16356_c0_g4_i1.p1  ORF type:complete len:398 (-),score=37.33 TRINITY_DN16356_c0_g4_i1:177-1370(-)